MKTKRLTINISEDLHKKLKMMALIKETNMTDLLLKLIKKELTVFNKETKRQSSPGESVQQSPDPVGGFTLNRWHITLEKIILCKLMDSNGGTYGDNARMPVMQTKTEQ